MKKKTMHCGIVWEHCSKSYPSNKVKVTEMNGKGDLQLREKTVEEIRNWRRKPSLLDHDMPSQTERKTF